MAYSHNLKWTDKMIENEILKVIKVAKIDAFPTHSQMDEITGNTALSNAVRKHGGSKYWADLIGVEVKACESRFGYDFECECMKFLSAHDYDCEHTKPRYPYDLLVNGSIKIDVKCCNLYRSKTGNFYTFNLEKAMPTCDIFVCYCIDANAVQKIYIIPSCALSGKTQLSIGEKNSKYDKYIGNWDVIKRYNDFYNSIV